MPVTPRTRPVAAVLAAAIVGTALACPFQDDFESGLDAWGPPFSNASVIDPVTAIVDGRLRMAGIVDLSNPGGLGIGLNESVTSDDWQDGTATVDVELDPFTAGYIAVRMDLDGLSSYTTFAVANGIDSSGVGIFVWQDGEFVVEETLLGVEIDMSSARIRASWSGGELSLVVTSLVTQESVSLSVSDAPVPPFSGVALVAAPGGPEASFGAWFDDFEIEGEECVPPCPADVDGDGSVAFADVLAVLDAFGACDGCPEDVSGDGVVGFDDILEVLAAFGPCS